MDLTNLSTNEILAELRKRGETVDSNDAVSVFGTIGIDGNLSFVEMFKVLKTAEDLDFINQISLRARFNPQRRYQGFYFKTAKFNELEKNLNQDNEKFANWVRETNSIKYTRL